MINLYRTLSWRYVQQRWSRAGLIVCFIALGVATLVATQALNQSMWLATRSAVTPLAGAADLHISNGDTGVPRSLADELKSIEGLRAVEPLVVGRVRLPDLGDQRHAVLLGIVWRAESAEAWHVKIDWTISPSSVPLLRGTDPQTVLSKLPEGFRPVLVGQELASELKGYTIRIQAARPNPPLLIKVGTVTVDGQAGEVVNKCLIMDAGDAAKLMGHPDLVTRIDLFLQPGADRDQVRSQVAQVLGSRAMVRTPEAHDELVKDWMSGLQISFLLCGYGALVVGLFLVYNALAVSVAERRHEIGILRSLGATRAQVWSLFIGEAAFLGLCGAILGVPAGWGLANLGIDFIHQVMSDLFKDTAKPRILVTPNVMVIAVFAGMVTAILASLVPARQAAKEQPASAVRRIPPTASWSHGVLHLAVCMALLTSGITCMVMRNHLPTRVGSYGGFSLVFIGMLLTIPLLAAGGARALRPFTRRYMGIEGRLAADNLVRSPVRTGLVITALAAGVALVLKTAGVLNSNEDPILKWVDQTTTADLFVTSLNSAGGSGQNLQLPSTMGRDIQAAFPDVAAVLNIRFRQVDYADKIVFLEAVDALGFAVNNQGHWPKHDLELFRRLGDPGQYRAQTPVIISDNFAALHGVGPGDSISLRGPQGPVSFQIIGSILDYSWNRGSVIIDRNVYQELFEDSLVDVCEVYLKPNADQEAIRKGLHQRWDSDYALVVLTREESRERVKGMIRRLAGIPYSQEFVVILVAALGVVFSLLISVLQRRRELGILRALGATRAQVLRSVLAEALLMGVIGTIIGLLVGVPMEWYIVRIIIWEEAGFLHPVSIPWVEGALISTMALVIATIAGLYPALHTMHLRIPEAISYE